MRIEPTPPRRRRSFLAPMVDVVFLLLLYFMLVSHYQQFLGIPLNAPAMSHGEASDSALLVAIEEDGTIRLAGQIVSLSAMTQQLRNAVFDNPELRVGVRPASKLPLQRLVQIMDEVRASGVSQLTLVRE